MLTFDAAKLAGGMDEATREKRPSDLLDETKATEAPPAQSQAPTPATTPTP